MYNEEKDFGISLAVRRVYKEYDVEYKGVEYIYILDVTDDIDEVIDLIRRDKKDTTDEEYDEIMALIDSIEDWDEVE